MGSYITETIHNRVREVCLESCPTSLRDKLVTPLNRNLTKSSDQVWNGLILLLKNMFSINLERVEPLLISNRMLQSSAELLDHAIDQDEDYGISREELMMLGNYLYTKSIQNLMQAGQSHWNDKIQERLLTNLISCLEMAWLGQWEDYITTYHCVNEEEYLNMVMNKSGKLYEIVFKSIGHLAELKEKDCQILAKAGNQIAVAAQLSNDIQGIYSPKKADLEQMKASVPIIRGIEYSKQQDQKLLHLLQKAEDSTSIEEIRPSILEYLEVNRLFEYTKVLINVYFNEGMDLMSKWTDHHHRKQFYELFGLKEV